MATTSKTGPDAAPPSGPRLGVSGAGWSEPGTAGGPTAPHPFATPAGERYVELDQLGAGGMGEVALVHDRRLERELAYKRAPLDRSDPEAAARLGREAQITAGLDHPGIVAVYDAGLDDDGRPFYTMRAVRGRSLAQHLADGASALARRTLVRQLLAVCEAIAYAHERGVIHRDLTPANVMLGDFGEVQVVDWGLAVRRGEDIVERGAGTPGYMSPERRAGRSAGGEPTSDVWALGTMLREVAGPAPLASELTAILARATATEPSARYLDAGALADDLRRYLDGRPVAAYTYSPLELARRALWAWRWPLATLAAALAVGGAVAVGAWQRVERARDRAVSAELAARAALADARTSLGHALAARAVRALEDHAIPEAEALAAQALVAVESPDARGVLAATRAVVAPRAAVHYRLPGCVTVLDADPVDALCVDGGELVLWSLAGNRVRWRVPGVPHDAVFGPNGTVLVTRFGEGVYALDRATGADRYTVGQGGRRSRLVVDPTAPQVAIHGNRHYTVTDLEHQIVLEDGMICGPDLTQDLEVIALAGARRVAACRDGSLWTTTVGEPWRYLGQLPSPEPDAPTAIALHADGRFAIGTSRGWIQWATVVPFALGRRERARFERIGQLVWAGDRLLVRGDRGGVQVWSGDGSGARLRLPATGNRRVRHHGDQLLAIGRGVWRWDLDATTGELGWTAAAGVSSVAVSPGGRWIAAGLPDGRVELRDATTGAVTTLALYDNLGVKQVGFTADGRELIVASAGPRSAAAHRPGDRRPPTDADDRHRRGALRDRRRRRRDLVPLRRRPAPLARSDREHRDRPRGHRRGRAGRSPPGPGLRRRDRPHRRRALDRARPQPRRDRAGVAARRRPRGRPGRPGRARARDRSRGRAADRRRRRPRPRGQPRWALARRGLHRRRDPAVGAVEPRAARHVARSRPAGVVGDLRRPRPAVVGGLGRPDPGLGRRRAHDRRRRGGRRGPAPLGPRPRRHPVSERRALTCSGSPAASRPCPSS
jgi:hypothetical protein